MKIILISSSIKGSLLQSYYKNTSGLNIPDSEVKILDDEKIYRDNFLAKNRYFHHFFWKILAIPLQGEIIKAVKLEKELV